MARQSTWGIDPTTGRPKLVNLGTGVGHTPITRGLLGAAVGSTEASDVSTPPTTVPTAATDAPVATTVPSVGTATTSVAASSPTPAQQGILGRTFTPAYQTQQTTEAGQTVGGFGDARGSYYGGTDSSGREMFFATPEEAAASLEQMDSLDGQQMGSLSRRVLDFANQHGLRPDAAKWNAQLGGRNRADVALNTTLDAATGLPFGIASTLLNPTVVPADAEGNLLGQQFNMGGAGLAGLGGTLNYRQLNQIAAEAQAGTPGYEIYSGPTSVTGEHTARNSGQVFQGTPLGISPAPFGPGEVVTGNTDLAIRQNPALDVNGDGQLTATELRQAAAVQQANQAATQARTVASEARSADEARRAAAEAQRVIEEARRVQEANAAAARAAEAERQRQANIAAANAELARSNRERESSGQAPQRGNAVVDSSGRAVRDSSGGIVTDRPTERDSGGGGGSSAGGK